MVVQPSCMKALINFDDFEFFNPSSKKINQEMKD